MSGEIEIALYTPNTGTDRQRVLVRPGLRQLVQVFTLVDGNPRVIDVEVEVRGSVCPNPSDHVHDCDETGYDRFGDCDGVVRPYIARTPVAGKAVGEAVLLCSNHAQKHGRHIRKALT